jgi:hypothetical protein
MIAERGENLKTMFEMIESEKCDLAGMREG